MSPGPTPFPLSDSDWARLSKLVGLPDEARADEARAELENILGQAKFLAELDETLSAPYETREGVAALRRRAERLLAALSDMEPDVLAALLEGDDLRFGGADEPPISLSLLPPALHEALQQKGKAPDRAAEEAHQDLLHAAVAEGAPVVPWSPPARMTRLSILNGCRSAVRNLAEWCAVTEQRIPKGERGDKVAGAHAVTRGIDALLFRHKGRHLPSTAKHLDPGTELLEACLELLELDVTADSMIRWLASERRSEVPAEKI